MKERPIIFSSDMVQAILEGRKTQTRRVMKPPLPSDSRFAKMLADGRAVFDVGNGWQVEYVNCPYGAIGDVLWIKHAADLFPVYFKAIPGWEGLYAAGTDGAIYRMDRGDPSPLSPSLNSKGYPTVSLSHGSWETHTVHRLVCETFYGPPPFGGAQVRHIDSDRQNSKPQNLDYGSQQDNWQDRKACRAGMGEVHHAAKLTDDDVAIIRSSSLSQRTLARQFGVSQATISSARLGKTWKNHTPYPRNVPEFKLWKSPIHMPRWASRITLEITDVRVERVQEITFYELQQEGMQGELTKAVKEYIRLWDSLNEKRGYPWRSNPWAWVIEFKRLERE